MASRQPPKRPAPNPPPPIPSPTPLPRPWPNWPERAALLEAAGFDSPKSASPEPADAANAKPTGEERSALLQAAGFESSDPPPASKPAEAPAVEIADDVDRPAPIYLKPLVWINAPLDACPPGVRSLLGGAALVTLANALAVLTYLFLTRRH